MTFKISLCIALTVFMVYSHQAFSAIVTPMSVTASSQFVEAERTIDGSGLIDNEGSVETQRHDNDEANGWLAGFGSSAEDESLEFTLDRNYDLSSAIIWQHNGLDGFGQPNTLRGINQFEILVSPDTVTPFTSVGTFNLAEAADPLNPAGEAAQTLALTGATNVRRVMFDIISAHGGPTLEFVGLSEVRFDGTALALPPDRSWNADSIADWFDGTSWSPSFPPNANTESAVFGGVIQTPRTIVVDQPATVASISFDSSISYAIAGNGQINLDADGTNAVLSVAGGDSAGTHQFQANVELLDDTDADIGTGSTLEFNNRLTLNGHTLTKTGDGNLAINNRLNSGGGMINVQEGVVSGVGEVSGDVVNSGGTISPGNSPGVLTIEGDYRQDAGGQLLIEIAAAEHDQLVVGGDADLSGGLNVELLDGFLPADGDVFTVLDVGGETTSNLGSVQLPALSSGLVWDLAGLESAGNLAVRLIPEPSTGTLLALAFLVTSMYAKPRHWANIA